MIFNTSKQYERIFQTALVLVAFVGVVTKFAAMTKSGIGWDHTIITWAVHTMNQINSQMTLKHAYDLTPSTIEFYGVFPQKSAELLHGIFTGNFVNLSENSPSTYLWQGLVSVTLSVIAFGTVSLVLGIIIKSWLASLWLFAVLITNPYLLGMAGTDNLDSLVASGLILLMSGLMGISLETRESMTRFKLSGRLIQQFLSVLCIFLGTFIAVCSRAGSIAIVVLILGLFAIFMIVDLYRKKIERQRLLTLSVLVLLGAISGVLAILLVNPIARINIFQWLYDSVNYAQKTSGWVGNIQTLGYPLLSTSLPWWYVPIWTFVSISFLLWIPISVSIFKLIKKLFNSKVSMPNIHSMHAFLVSIPFTVTAGIIFNQSVLYDGLRHIYFIIPILISTVVFAFESTFRNAQTQAIKPLMLGALLLIPIYGLASSSQWIPYSYAYKNEVANLISRGEPKWELDYWGTSSREGVELLRNKYNLKEVIVIPHGDMATIYGASHYKLNSRGELELENGRTLPDVFGVYVFHRYTWSRTSKLPITNCGDLPLVQCVDFKPFDCKVLFRVIHAGHELGYGGACLRPGVKSTYYDRLPSIKVN